MSNISKIIPENTKWDAVLDFWYFKIRNPIRDWISPKWYRIFGPKPHIIRTKMTPCQYADQDSRLFYAMMTVIEEFVTLELEPRFILRDELYEDCTEEEIKSDQESEQWQEQKATEAKIMEIYTWWKNYPLREMAIEDALNEWYESTNIETPETDKLHRKLKCLEKQLADETQEMLHNIVDVRTSLWT